LFVLLSFLPSLFCSLAINWFFALGTLSGRLKLSQRQEKAFVGTATALATLFVLPYFVLGFLQPNATLSLGGRLEIMSQSTKLMVNAQVVLENLFHGAFLFLALFVWASSVAGIIMFRRTGTASSENMLGLVKMCVFASVLAACSVVTFVYQVMEVRLGMRVSALRE
jgi:hypothetical protein